MPEQAQLDVLINSIANTAGFATAKAELAALGGGFTPLGGGTVNFGGSLSKEEQAAAAAQMGELEAKTKAAAAARRDLANAAGLGMGAGGLGILGVGAGVGIDFAMLKSVVDNTEAQQRATNDLAQAYGSVGEKVPTNQIDTFIDQNQRFIPSIYSVEEGYAQLTRSGLSQTEVQKDMNRALDLAALKHIDLSQAVLLLDQAEHGRMRGLIDLGITTAKYTDASGNLIQSQHSVQQAMAELDPKLKGGRDTTTDLAQAQNRLNVEWERMANTNGPLVLGFLTGALNDTTDFLNFLTHVDLGGFQNALMDGVIGPLKDFRQMLKDAGDDWNKFVRLLGGNPSAQGGTTYRNPRGGNFAGSAVVNRNLMRLTSN